MPISTPQASCLETTKNLLAEESITLADLAPLYEHLCQEIGWSPDAAQLQRMQSANQEKLQELDGKIKDAEENLGDTEVKEALTAKADYLCRIGQCFAAEAAAFVTITKSVYSAAPVDKYKMHAQSCISAV